MKRQTFRATLTINGEDAGESIGYAFNSTVRKSEALVRDYARSIGRIFHGEKPTREGNTYTRAWFGGDIQAVATVTEVKQ